VSPDGTDSLAASQSILAAVTMPVEVPPSGESADGAGSQMDVRDNQLDELSSQVPTGVQIGSIGAAPNSSDSLFEAVAQTPNSDSCVVGPNSNSVNSKESSNLDDVAIIDNVYETSSEGLLTDEESSDNDSDNEKEFIDNVVHSDNKSSANMDVVTKNTVPSVNIVSPESSLSGPSVSSGDQPSRSNPPVAVGKGSRPSVSSKIPKASGAGVHKTAGSRPAGLTSGLRRAARVWGELSLAANEMAATLNLATLNVNGLRLSDKRGGVLRWLWSLPASVDVVCLQETHCVSEEECRLWFSATGLLSVVSPGSRHACGCVVLYRPHLSLVRSWKDDDGRLAFCEFSFRGEVFRVLCLYAPNRNPARDEFLERVSDRVDPSVPTIVCGDFNTVFDRGLDRSGSDPLDSSRDSSAVLSCFFDDSCVFDAWRSLHPDVRAFTWMRPNGAFASRIDLIGLPVAWSASLVSCDIIPCPFSDHCAVLLSTKVPDVLERGPGLWKLNCSVLSEDEYVDMVSSFWSHWRSRRESFPSVADWWERGKSRLKGLTITYCKERASRRRE